MAIVITVACCYFPSALKRQSYPTGTLVHWHIVNYLRQVLRRFRSLLIRFSKFTGRCLLFFLFAFFILNILFPLKVRVPYSTLVTDKSGQILHAFLASDQKWRMYTELDEITPGLEKAIVFKEDRWFYYHPGFNPVAILRAGFNNVINRKRTSGASTISMQVARLLYPGKRTYGNKLGELFRAMQLELRYSKKEILQMYLNLVPYGGNVEGVKSAAMLYFKKTPGLLSLAEITTLAIIPNRPSSLRLGVNNPYIVSERNRRLLNFKSAALFPEGQINDALEEPLDVRRHSAPKLAPHLSLRLKRMEPDAAIIRTAIKSNTQLKTEQIVRNCLARLNTYRIRNAAVLIINNRTMQVETYVGSGDFNNVEDGGQVDGVLALRSPGSALKPLLYASCFDAGLASPKTIVNDVPGSFGSYEPENYDMTFSGMVSVESALANSLNIPAVKMLEAYGLKNFISRLKKAGFESIKKNENQFGLSIALGGCGVSLEELCGLFCTFANKGVYSRLKYHSGDSSRSRMRIISPQSAYLLTEILSQVQRPDLPNNYKAALRVPRIAWKTGTSYGRKDAWSIGYNRSYTIGVWVGNFSGMGVPELSGANIATPLLFEIFNTVDYNAGEGWNIVPEGIDYRYVCSESGLPPSEFCSNKVIEAFIPGVSPTKACEHKMKVFVNPDASISYCGECLEPGARSEWFYQYAPELIAFYESRHIPYQRLPLHNPRCERVFSTQAPKITGLLDGADYFTDGADPQKISLSCHAGANVQKVYWYVNDKFLGSSDPGSPMFFLPSEGKTKISCTDDKGRTSSIVIHIKAL